MFDGNEEIADEQLENGYLVDYLKVNLEVWDTASSSSDQSTLSRPIIANDFGENLRQYASKRQYEQCCNCGTALKASEWMSAQVPKVSECKVSLIVWKEGVHANLNATYASVPCPIHPGKAGLA